MADTNATSFGSILKKMFSECRTGRLLVESAEAKIVIHIDQGKVVRVEGSLDDEWLAGEYLVGTGILSPGRMRKALRLAKERNIAPELVLLSRGWVSKETLSRWVESQARQTILPLFAKVGIMVRFLTQEPNPNALMSPIPIPMLLRDGVKRVAEWPAILKRVSNFNLVYGRDDTNPSAMPTQDEQGSDKGTGLGPNERIVHYFIDGRRNVRELARISGLDLFFVARALFRLEARFLIKVVGEKSASTLHELSIVPYIFRGLIGACILVAIGAIAIYEPGPVKLLTGRDTLNLKTFQAARTQATRAVIKDCLEEDYLLRGQIPSTLVDLSCMRDKDPRLLNPFSFSVVPDKGFKLEIKR
jgi:hypothetical protein